MFTPNSHYNELSMWSSIARNQTTITSAWSLVQGMGWYLLCTALLLPISLLHPHLLLFPLPACLCFTLPLPSTAPPSWSHLETEQVLWRDRGRLRKASPPRLMTPVPSSAQLCWNSFSAAARLKPDESRKHHRSQGRLEMVSCRWGSDFFECMHSYNKMLAFTSAYVYTYSSRCACVYVLSKHSTSSSTSRDGSTDSCPVTHTLPLQGCYIHIYKTQIISYILYSMTQTKKKAFYLSHSLSRSDTNGHTTHTHTHSTTL